MGWAWNGCRLFWMYDTGPVKELSRTWVPSTRQKWDLSLNYHTPGRKPKRTWLGIGWARFGSCLKTAIVPIRMRVSFIYSHYSQTVCRLKRGWRLWWMTDVGGGQERRPVNDGREWAYNERWVETNVPPCTVDVYILIIYVESQKN